MFANLSVLETLRYSALLRLPGSLSKEEKLKKVNAIIKELGLEGCKNVKIGNSESKGISGGERKRVAIGMELVTDPDILFLDEPTSGLDAFTAFNIIKTVKKIAIEQNRIVIMTIHQPRTDILNLFDKVLLLSAGNTIWYGSTEDALRHFKSLGFQIPPNTNPSDYFSDISTLDRRSEELEKESSERIKLFKSSWDKVSNIDEPSSGGDRRGLSSNPSNKTAWPSSWFHEFGILFHRNMVDVSRDAATLGATLGQGIIITLILGFVYFQLPTSIAGIQDRIGALFFICVNQTFGIVMPIIGVFPEQKLIIKRERAAGTYRASSAFVAKFISSLPLAYAGSLLLSIPVYWMIGLQNNAVRYLTFICIVLVHTHVANALGLMIGAAVPNAQVGQIFGPLIIVVMFLFAGQLINLDSVPVVFRWIQYISIIAYSNKALAQNEFEGLTFTCGPTAPPTCRSQTGAEVLSTFGLDNISLWNCVIINVAISFGFAFLGYLFFQRTSAPLMRLRTDPPGKEEKKD